MKLFYWKTKGNTNFGDELNPWLWSRFLPDVFDEDGSVMVLGIGSVLYDSFLPDVKKIVFGSGYAGYSDPPKLDDSWEVMFVRGPRSSAALGVDPSLAISDPAMLVGEALKDATPIPKSGRGAFMPHWESSIDGAWKAAAESAGLDFIDSRWTVDKVLPAIRSADFLVTEAMHGAIVADALRVPWIPFAPLPLHQFKWFDWADSVNVKFVFMQTAPTTWLEIAVRACGYNERAIWLVRFGRPLRLLGSKILRRGAVKALKKAATSRRYLSTDETLSDVNTRLLEQVARLRARRAFVVSR